MGYVYFLWGRINGHVKGIIWDKYGGRVTLRSYRFTT